MPEKTANDIRRQIADAPITDRYVMSLTVNGAVGYTLVDRENNLIGTLMIGAPQRQNFAKHAMMFRGDLPDVPGEEPIGFCVNTALGRYNAKSKAIEIDMLDPDGAVVCRLILDSENARNMADDLARQADIADGLVPDDGETSGGDGHGSNLVN